MHDLHDEKMESISSFLTTTSQSEQYDMVLHMNATVTKYCLTVAVNDEKVRNRVFKTKTVRYDFCFPFFHGKNQTRWPVVLLLSSCTARGGRGWGIK